MTTNWAVNSSPRSVRTVHSWAASSQSKPVAWVWKSAFSYNP